MDADRVDAVIGDLKAKTEVSNEDLCFTCHSNNGNWLSDVQDALEDHNVSLEAFCACKKGAGITGESFVVTRGRLRLMHSMQCVCIRHIRGILANL